MSDTHIVARDQLRSFIERIERLEVEKQTIADDIKDVYGEAKATGFDAKILRKVISIRKQDTDERLEQEAILATYLSALGMIQMDMFEEPEPETSPKLVATVATAMQTQAGRAALLSAVDIMIEREERQESDGGAIAAVKGKARLANATGVEPPPSERFDPETGEILDDAPRADGGLDIVTKHTEIATNEGGANQGEELAQGSTPDLEPSGPDVNGHPNSPEEANVMDRDEMRGGDAVHSVPAEKGREAIPAGPEGVDLTHADAGEIPAPSFLTKPPSPLRPHCQRPEMCAGVGRTHCHTCSKAMREQEEFA